MSLYHRAFITLALLSQFVGCQPVAETPTVHNTTDDSAALSPASSVVTGSDQPTRRKFRFTYGATLTEIAPGTEVSVWLPVATDRHEQKVTIEEIQLPGEYTKTTEQRFGNQLFHFTAQANSDGEVPMRIVYLVDRAELATNGHEPATATDTERYLTATQKVPVDATLRTTILGDDQPAGPASKVARNLYDAVDTHMRYDKPIDKPGWGNGDATWACGNGFGNCTDFHSLFISAARNLKIPSRFEIGFMIPARESELKSGPVGGYHCWAKYLSDGKWLPVDISEADKHPELKDYYFGSIGADRITFTTGRDLELTPPNATGPINYLVYPYAEIDGKQHKSFRKEFSYDDL